MSRIAFLRSLSAVCVVALGCSGSTTSSNLSAGGASTTTSTGGMGGASTSSTGGAAGATTTATGPIDFCTGCSLGPACTTWTNLDLIEASGVVASSLHDGVYFLHNDSGDSARFFATSCAGEDLGVFKVKDVTSVDWEDVARGPCGIKTCLYFADVGDNLENRTDYAVYRVEEPASIGKGDHDVTASRFPFLYPDGSHDAETILVHPTTGEIAIVTKLKAAGKSGIYAFPTPLEPNKVVTLVKVGEVAVPSGSFRITAGDVHPSGKGILLRTYTSLFFYPMSEGQTIEASLAGAPCEMPVMLELQGESVAFTLDGRGYLTASEQSGQSLHLATCK